MRVKVSFEAEISPQAAVVLWNILSAIVKLALGL